MQRLKTFKDLFNHKDLYPPVSITFAGNGNRFGICDA